MVVKPVPTAAPVLSAIGAGTAAAVAPPALPPGSPVGALPHKVIWSPQAGPQTRLITCPCDEILYGGARGGGKTDGSIGDWISHCFKYGNRARGIWFRRTLEELADVKERMRVLFLSIGARFSTKDNSWTFPNGAKLLLRYLESDDDADRYLGHQYTWMCVEELGNFKSPVPIDKIKGTLRSATGVKVRFIATCNPGGKGHKWIKERYVDPAPPGVPFQNPETKAWCVFIPSKLSDNKLLVENDPGYANRLKGTGPARLVKAWLDGDWNLPNDGKIFLREYFTDNRYDNLPSDEEVLQVIQSWDLANKDGPENDRTACVTFAITDKAAYVVHAWAGRMKFPEQVRKVKDMAARTFCGQAPAIIVIEDKGNGIALIDQLKSETGLNIVAYNPGKADKEARAIAQSVHVEAEPFRVLFPQAAEWLDELIDELCSFGDAPHDDLVDAFVQALAYIFKRFPNLSGVKKALGVSLTPRGVAVAKTKPPRATVSTAAEYEAYEAEYANSEACGF